DSTDITQEPKGGHETLLVVEDESSVLDLDKRILTHLGYRVHAFDDPTEALNAADKGEGIDLLITDVIMPKMTGRDLAHALRGKFPDLKILFVSGYSTDIISNQGFLEEEAFFLEKPFSLNDLAAKVRSVLNSK
ncbi:MAG TPA: response regulator, partial [Spirochaetota bacterium]|nr:response regulator [Spirochaetota bacterium]